MSGFFGIFNRNGNPIDKNIAGEMLETMSSWEPDESNLWIDGSIALRHAMLWNTPESKYEHLPMQKDTYVLTMDARIDNRDELAKELTLPDLPMGEIGDSEFILVAYEKWGEECPKHLLGDFAFAIWDSEKEQLFCARDHVGIKSLYFFCTDDRFIFSNDILSFLGCSEIPKGLDKNTIAFFIKSNYLHSKQATFFESIKKLPPAMSMIVTKDKINETTYWSLEKSPIIHYKTFGEYVEQLRKLYDDAIEVRLRTDYTVGSHMSGGIDSSPIAVLASQKLHKIEKPLYTFNWIDIPEDKNKYEYEAWNFSRRIAAGEENIIHEEFKIDPAYIEQCIRTHNIFTQGTMYYWGENYIQCQMKRMNARVILSGWGGDELISYNGYSYISGLISQGKIFTAFYYLLQEKKYLSYSWKKLLKRTLINFLSPNALKVFRKLRNYKSNYRNAHRYRYLTKEFESFMKSHKDAEIPSVRGVRKNQLAQYNFGHIQHRIESWALMGQSNRIEYRYPLLDKRIIEFAIGIPEELFFLVECKERFLIKMTVSDLLPSDIVWFAKPSETKINQSLEKDYKNVLKIIRSSMNKIDYKRNSYIDYEKLKADLNKIEIDRLEMREVEKIVAVCLVQNSYDIIKENF
ncbi:MAG: asparagine synthase-related protein [Sulfurovum sp.]